MPYDGIKMIIEKKRLRKINFIIHLVPIRNQVTG